MQLKLMTVAEQFGEGVFKGQTVSNSQERVPQHFEAISSPF